jgi:hypothetical protein
MERLPIPGVTNVWALILRSWDETGLMGCAFWGTDRVRVRCVGPDLSVLWRVARCKDCVLLRLRDKFAEEASATGGVAVNTLTGSTGIDALSAATGRGEEGALAVLLQQPMGR